MLGSAAHRRTHHSRQPSLHTRREKPTQALANAAALDADGFVAAVRAAVPQRIKFTAADIADLKRGHAETIEPARRARAEIFALERQISDLVNDAYGYSTSSTPHGPRRSASLMGWLEITPLPRAPSAMSFGSPVVLT